MQGHTAHWYTNTQSQTAEPNQLTFMPLYHRRSSVLSLVYRRLPRTFWYKPGLCFTGELPSRGHRSVFPCRPTFSTAVKELLSLYVSLIASVVKFHVNEDPQRKETTN